MLAASAAKAGFTPIVVDLFADMDTRQLSACCYQVKSLALQDLVPVLKQLKNQYPDICCVYGSGFEGFPQSLAMLMQNFSVAGNPLSSFNKILDKRYFFSCLAQWGMAYPSVDFSKNRSVTGLIKSISSVGGEGVTVADTPLPADHYWQERIDGLPLSVMFLAHSGQTKCIGFNLQWTEPGSYMFSGIMNQCELPNSEIQRIKHWLTLLVQGFQLHGLNSLDFIWDGQRSYLLEINARPPASLALYDDDFDKGLLAEHLNPSIGRMDSTLTISGIKAYQIVYAEQDLIIPEHFDWPDWTADQPAAGSVIHCGNPVCSMIAEAETAAQVRERLVQNKTVLFSDSLLIQHNLNYLNHVSI